MLFITLCPNAEAKCKNRMFAVDITCVPRVHTLLCVFLCTGVLDG